jgi:hypothetical protein
MGCACSRGTMSEEEYAITKGEAGLGFAEAR